MAVVGVCACGFTPETASDAAQTPPDAPDASPDAPSSGYSPCTIAGSGTPSPAAVLGGNGGSAKPDVVCVAGELPVGMAFEVANPPNPSSLETVVRQIHVRCGTLRRTTSGEITTTAAEIATSAINSTNCETWPDTPVAERDCPSGEVLVGMTANRAASSLYNSVVLRCAPLSPTLVLGAISTVSFAGTGADADAPQVSPCPMGSVLVGFSVLAGCANDQLTPRCAAIACE